MPVMHRRQSTFGKISGNEEKEGSTCWSNFQKYYCSLQLEESTWTFLEHVQNCILDSNIFKCSFMYSPFTFKARTGNQVCWGGRSCNISSLSLPWIESTLPCRMKFIQIYQEIRRWQRCRKWVDHEKPPCYGFLSSVLHQPRDTRLFYAAARPLHIFGDIWSKD